MSTTVEALTGGERSYVVRLHAVVTADDNGTNKSPVTAARITSVVAAANTIYASTGVSIVFDPATDLEIVNSTLLNQRFLLASGVDLTTYTNKSVKPPTTSATPHNSALLAHANDHFGKIVVFFTGAKELVFDDDLGHWVLRNDGGGSSSSGSRSVWWSGQIDASSLAHEVGHYLHQSHPFRGAAPTNAAEAAALIKSYVDDGHPRADGLNVFDGDREVVLDTLPDARGGFIASLNPNPDPTKPGDACGPNGTLDVTVQFAPGDTQTYTIAPDRTLVMSYFKGCFNDRFTPDQGTRMRESLELLNRRDLVSLPDSTSASLQEVDSAVAGAVTSYDAAFIGNGRLVTATINPSKVFKLTVWEVDSDGEIVQRGSDTVSSNVGDVAITDGGLSQVVTISHAPGHYRQNLRTFKVDGAGAITNTDYAFVDAAGPVTGIDIEHFDRMRLITTTETGGEVRLRGWKVVADGTATPASLDVVAGSGSLARLARLEDGAMLYFRGSDADLKVRNMELDDDLIPVLAGSAGGEAVTAVDGASLSLERSASVIGLNSLQQRVILWDRDSVSDVVSRQGTFTAPVGEQCAKNDSAPVGVNYLATACVQETTGELLMRLFRVASGTPIVASSFTAGIYSDVELAHVGNDTLVAVMRTTSGELELRSWKISLF